jgi:hypothetical protein
MSTITRAGYHREAHRRKAYTKSDGTHIKATHVKAAYVQPTEIQKRGQGTGNVVIDMKDYRHLSDSGYKFSLLSRARHVALENAASKHGYQFVVHRLSAIATLLRYTEPALSKKA